MIVCPLLHRRRSEEMHLAAFWQDGKLQPVPECFDTSGAALLAEARAHPEGLILMDECGRLEKEAFVFQKEIFQCLEGDIPVLGVLRKDQPWHDFIKSHPRVRIITITGRASDDLPAQNRADNGRQNQ